MTRPRIGAGDNLRRALPRTGQPFNWSGHGVCQGHTTNQRHPQRKCTANARPNGYCAAHQDQAQKGGANANTTTGE